MAAFLVIGLDGATFRIIDPLIARGKLPHLARLKAEGSFGTLQSTIHPFSAQAWSSFMTGVNPGKHGIFDFTHHEKWDYRLKFVNAADRKADSLWKILSSHGLRVAVVNVPLTFPPEQVNGLLISGMDAPGKGSDFVYPSSLLAEIERNVGPYTIELSVRDYIRRGGEEEFIDQLRQMISYQVDVVRYLINKEKWNLFAFVFRATDQIQHWYWKFMDPDHPYHPQEVPRKLETAIEDIYRDLDKAIGEIEKQSGPETHLLILSDHGQGPNRDRAFYINKWLRSQGFLRFVAENERRRPKGRGHQEALLRSIEWLKKVLPRFLKAFLLQRFPSLRDHTETMQAFSEIDFDRTVAYSDDLRGNIWINLKGRQPKGKVDASDYELVRDDIMRLIRLLRDPLTGEPIFDNVFRREDLYYGPFLSTAPDIVFTQPGDRQRFMLRRSRPNGDLNAYVETIDESEVGVWPNGSHTLDGIFLLKGAGVRHAREVYGAHIVDLAPTILYLMGIPIPENMDGSVLREAIEPSLLRKRPTAKAPFSAEQQGTGPQGTGYTEEETASIRERLKDLGYIE